MRETYSLSEETRTVLTDKVKAIAYEMPCDPSYLYQILSNVECDSFAKFRRLFAAAVRAGADVTPWLATLNAIHIQNEADAVERCLSKKIKLDADTDIRILDALKDGEIDERERAAIRKAIQRERDSLDALDRSLDATDARATATVKTFAKFNGNGGHK